MMVHSMLRCSSIKTTLDQSLILDVMHLGLPIYHPLRNGVMKSESKSFEEYPKTSSQVPKFRELQVPKFRKKS